jgi:molecular chaperone GrpE
MPIRHFVSTSVRNIVIRYPKHSLLQFSKFSTEGANTENQQEAPQPSEIDKLKEENQKLAAEIKDLKDKILRVYADEENVRRIAKKDVENAKNYANTKFAKSMLDIADNLERALSNVNNELKTSGESPAVRNLLTGLEMTYNELDKVFKSQGLVKVIITIVIF